MSQHIERRLEKMSEMILNHAIDCVWGRVCWWGRPFPLVKAIREVYGIPTNERWLKL
jgi:hypothetical protein